MENQDSILAREGGRFPGATYKEVVLGPAYENAKRELLPAMIAANKAHLIMLVEQNFVSQGEATTVMRAIAELEETELRASPYTGEFEDLFFHVEHLILERAGDPAGNLPLARSRNDTWAWPCTAWPCATVYCAPRGRCWTCRTSFSQWHPSTSAP